MLYAALALCFVFLLGLLLDRLEALPGRTQQAMSRLAAAERKARRRTHPRLKVRRMARALRR